MEKVFEIYIKTTPEELWEAINEPGLTARLLMPEGQEDGFVASSGEELESDPPRKLVRSMTAEWSDEVKAEGTTRITWEIEPVGTSCRLVVTHDQMRENAHSEIWGGWPMILSALKTRIETGEHLETPASIRYGQVV